MNKGPDANEMTDILEEFTDTYRSYDPREIEMREAACIRVQTRGRIKPIEEQDLFAGRMVQMPIGFIPQSVGTGMGYCIHPDIGNRLLNKPELNQKNRRKLAALLDYWQREGTIYKSRRKMPKKVRTTIPSELYYQEPGIAFSLYRMSGIQLDYKKLLDLGIPGLKAEVKRYLVQSEAGSKSQRLYTAIEHVLDSFSLLCADYALLVTMNKGIDPYSGKAMGMPLECYLKYKDFKTFEDLLKAYKEQVEYHVGPLALQEYLEYKHAANDNAYLLSSLLMDDCLARGRAIFDGGIRYMGGTLETYGNTNTSDSLVAIRELVYQRKTFTLEELNHMLKANFEGYRKELKMIRNCPKYWNDNDVADSMYMEVHNHICMVSAEQAEKVGLDSYLVVIINNDANTVMGTFTAASPDGRLAFTHLNPGNNPAGGADRRGITACMNSLLKPDTGRNPEQNLELGTDHSSLTLVLNLYLATLRKIHERF